MIMHYECIMRLTNTRGVIALPLIKISSQDLESVPFDIESRMIFP
jgi:hypothetical protein